LLTPFATSISNLAALRFLTGLGLGGALPTAISLTSEYTPTRLRATVVALMFCGFPLGAVIGGFAMAKLIPILGWTSAFYAGGVIPLLLLPLVAGWVPESIRFLALKGDRTTILSILDRMKLGKRWDGKVELESEKSAPILSLFAEGTALGTTLLWITFFFSLMLSYFLLNWIPMLARQEGHSVEDAVIAVAMINLGAIIGCITLGHLAGRFGQATVIGAGYGLGAFAIMAIGYVGTSSTLLLGISVSCRDPDHRCADVHSRSMRQLVRHASARDGRWLDDGHREHWRDPWSHSWWHLDRGRLHSASVFSLGWLNVARSSSDGVCDGMVRASRPLIHRAKT